MNLFLKKLTKSLHDAQYAHLGHCSPNSSIPWFFKNIYNNFCGYSFLLNLLILPARFRWFRPEPQRKNRTISEKPKNFFSRRSCKNRRADFRRAGKTFSGLYFSAASGSFFAANCFCSQRAENPFRHASQIFKLRQFENRNLKPKNL